MNDLYSQKLLKELDKNKNEKMLKQSYDIWVKFRKERPEFGYLIDITEKEKPQFQYNALFDLDSFMESNYGESYGENMGFDEDDYLHDTWDEERNEDQGFAGPFGWLKKIFGKKER